MNSEWPGADATAGDALGQAVALHRAGRYAAAETAYRNILLIKPEHADAWQLLGVLLARGRRTREGVEAMRRSLRLNDEQPAVHANLGNALYELGEYAPALAHLSRAIDLEPGLESAWLNHGGALHALGRSEEALRSCDQAIRLAPRQVLPVLHRACSLERLGRIDEALSDYARAVTLRPELHDVHLSRALLLARCGRYPEAAQQLVCLERIAPCHPGAKGLLLHVQMWIADWSGWQERTAAIRTALSAGLPAAPPLAFLAMSDSGAMQLACAAAYADANRPSDGNQAPTAVASRRHERIRVGYLSPDFTEHAVSFLMAGVFEQHDRQRFEPIALALRQDTASAMGRRTRSAFDRVVDLEGSTDEAVAARVRAEEIDILVDLTGYTSGYRGGILARRPAPVQVSYLGFPGTLGRSSADYLIADDFVIPETSRAFYSEAIAYVPECFQGNDQRRAPAGDRPSRTAVGLPEHAFVFGSFHSTYKINPPLFDIWMRLLERESRSVLWLLLNDATAERNIRAEAAARGVDSQRIVAARTLPYPQHLARLGLVDLCLDTWPFNGGATTSDALFAGVPVVTCAGEAFAARMSGSLLRCAGLDELVTYSLEDYERTAAHLAGTPGLLADLRARLHRCKLQGPLFDSGRFCRHLEAAYLEMHERACRGAAPASFRIGPLP